MGIAKPDLIIFLVCEYDFLRCLKERIKEIVHNNLDPRTTQHYTCIPNLVTSMPEKRSADRVFSPMLCADDPDLNCAFRRSMLSVPNIGPGAMTFER